MMRSSLQPARAPGYLVRVAKPKPALAIDTVPASRSEIDLDNARELKWWTKRLACNEVQLREAVARVGPKAAHVEQLLDGVESILAV
ncbi:DUF3606 domain-containing protein [Ramlibacter sp. MMS24-I3-19]|uniref:DUF3606 domain-containing protein n=1 Tax=Ramlibacter sp. MMS24-I3-19 TaxID=3416606 RepID=UPI003D05E7A4